ncbi:HEPN domain-containing protein, partial [Frankia sp. Cas4]
MSTAWPRQNLRWPPRKIDDLRRRLDELSATVNGKPPDSISEEVRSWLARLLVVRSCGYLEQVVAEVCRGYIEEKSGGRVRSYARASFERLNHPGSEFLLSLVRRFGTDLENELRAFLDQDDQRVRRELEFLVNRRHRI